MININKEKQRSEFGFKVKQFLISRIVTIVFVIICLLCFKLSGLSLTFYVRDLISRLSRNLFLIMALIVPVLAGMGLNFAIVLGAMAGQIAVILVTHFGVTGFGGFLLCLLVTIPFSLLFGYLIGLLLNKTKGQEMITSLILGFFANGVYQFVLLILVGSVIPFSNPKLVLSRGYGIKNTVDLQGGLKYSLDKLVHLPFPTIAFYGGMVALVLFVGLYWYQRHHNGKTKHLFTKVQLIVYGIISLLVALMGIVLMNSESPLKAVQVPIATFFLIGCVAFFNIFIVKTKLGQDFRAVGMDQHVARVSGINVNRTRIIAIMISIVLAAWGQVIFLQNLGNLNTYGSHGQVGVFAIAAILIGGASVSKATVGQAVMGALLFHTLFMLSPIAGRNLMGDAQMGEFFRAFVAYGVIALSLGMHAWKKQALLHNAQAQEDEE